MFSFRIYVTDFQEYKKKNSELQLSSDFETNIIQVGFVFVFPKVIHWSQMCQPRCIKRSDILYRQVSYCAFVVVVEILVMRVTKLKFFFSTT